MNNLGTFCGEKAIYIPVAQHDADDDVDFKIKSTVLFLNGRPVVVSPMAWGATEDKMWVVFKPPAGFKPGVYTIRIATEETFPVEAGDAPDAEPYVQTDIEDFTFRWGPQVSELSDKRLSELLDESIGEDGKLKLSSETQSLRNLTVSVAELGDKAITSKSVTPAFWDAVQTSLASDVAQKAFKVWMRDVLRGGVDARVAPVQVADKLGYQLARESIDAIIPPDLLKSLSRLRVNTDGTVNTPAPQPIDKVADTLEFSAAQTEALAEAFAEISSLGNHVGEAVAALATGVAANLKKAQDERDAHAKQLAEIASSVKMLATAIGGIPDPPKISLTATAVLTELSSGGGVLSVSVPSQPDSIKVQLLDGSGAVIVNNSQWTPQSIPGGAFSFSLPEMQPHGVRYARIHSGEESVTVPVSMNYKPQQPMMVMAAPGATSNG